MSARRFQSIPQPLFRYLVAVAAIMACNSFAEHSIAQETPMTFVQRRDVSREIRATAAQLIAARSLGDVCDEACQQRMRQTLQDLDPSFFQHFQALSPEERQQLATTANRENREIVEMEILEDNILAPLQMVRFNQLWQQNLGVGALTSPATTQLLNMSPEQINQIQQFQNDATALINACWANPNLTNAQKNTFITNINNITIDNSISILENAQIGELTINLGQPFTFDDADPTAPSDPTGPTGPLAPSAAEPLPQGLISGAPPSLIAQNGSQGSTTRSGLTESTPTQNRNLRVGNRTNTRTRNNTPRNSGSRATRSRNTPATATQATRSRPSRAAITRTPQRSQPAPSRSSQPGNQGSGRR